MPVCHWIVSHSTHEILEWISIRNFFHLIRQLPPLQCQSFLSIMSLHQYLNKNHCLIFLHNFPPVHSFAEYHSLPQVMYEAQNLLFIVCTCIRFSQYDIYCLRVYNRISKTFSSFLMAVTSTQTYFTALMHAEPLSGNGKTFKCIYET